MSVQALRRRARLFHDTRRVSFAPLQWAFLAAVVTTGIASPVWAQTLKHFDIPRQELASALEAFGRQGEQEILFDREQTRGKSSTAVKGDFEAEQALSALLSGTGLESRRVNSSTFLVKPDAKAASAQNNNNDDAILSEVVVTAQKRSERAQDVPASISVLGGQQLERLHATNLQDYAAYAPGLVVTAGGTPGQSRITLRGLNTLSPATMVATVLDDTPVGSSNSWASESHLAFDMMPYDIERIEILRGPQGTLYGANSMGGLLKYVNRLPNLQEFEARAGAEAFSVQGGAGVGYAGRFAVSMPLIPGTLALRISLYDEETPGYIDNPLTGQNDENELAQRGGRLALLWQPSDSLSVKLQAINQLINSANNSIVARGILGQSPDPAVNPNPDPNLPLYYIGGAPLAGDLTHPHLLNEPFKKDVSYFSATVNWSTGWSDFTSASSYSRASTHVTQDLSDGVLPLLGFRSAFVSSLNLGRFTQEFRLASPTGGKLEWLIGSYYSYEDSKNNRLLSALDSDNHPVPVQNPLFTESEPTLYKEIALFANSTYQLTDAWDVTGGLRWAKNKQSNTDDSIAGPNGIFTDFHTRDASAEGVVTWATSSRYHINNDVMLYSRIATGYRPGGPNSTAGEPAGLIPSQVNSDTTINYEAGVKSQFLDRKMLLDVSVFKVNWKDIQLQATLDNNTFAVNGGRASSQGVEFSSSYSPVRGLQLGFNAAYTDAKITQDVNSTAVHWLNGAQLPGAPKWTASFTAAYEFFLWDSWRARLGGGYRYVGAQFTDVQSATYVTRLPGYCAMDLNAGIQRGRWDLSLYLKNATNNRAYSNQSVNTDFLGNPLNVHANGLQPRTVGLSLDTQF